MKTLPRTSHNLKEIKTLELGEVQRCIQCGVMRKRVDGLFHYFSPFEHLGLMGMRIFQTSQVCMRRASTTNTTGSTSSKMASGTRGTKPQKPLQQKLPRCLDVRMVHTTYLPDGEVTPPTKRGQKREDHVHTKPALHDRGA